jgi:hypothetical protein
MTVSLINTKAQGRRALVQVLTHDYGVHSTSGSHPTSTRGGFLPSSAKALIPRRTSTFHQSINPSIYSRSAFQNLFFLLF